MVAGAEKESRWQCPINPLLLPRLDFGHAWPGAGFLYSIALIDTPHVEKVGLDRWLPFPCFASERVVALPATGPKEIMEKKEQSGYAPKDSRPTTSKFEGWVPGKAEVVLLGRAGCFPQMEASIRDRGKSKWRNPESGVWSLEKVHLRFGEVAASPSQLPVACHLPRLVVQLAAQQDPLPILRDPTSPARAKPCITITTLSLSLSFSPMVRLLPASHHQCNEVKDMSSGHYWVCRRNKSGWRSSRDPSVLGASWKTLGRQEPGGMLSVLRHDSIPAQSPHSRDFILFPYR